MILAEFYLSDGTDRINLLGGPFYLSEWKPGTAEFKGGGVFVDSPLSDGRRPAFLRVQNVPERIDVALVRTNVDDLEDSLRDLKSLLAKAAMFWQSRGRVGDMVYLARRHSRADIILYAPVFLGRVTNRANPFAAPFLQPCGNRLESELSLLLERGEWFDVVPGSSVAIPSSIQVVTTNAVQNPSFESGGAAV